MIYKWDLSLYGISENEEKEHMLSQIKILHHPNKFFVNFSPKFHIFLGNRDQGVQFGVQSFVQIEPSKKQ